MNALWQIILRILWRLRPVMALEVNLHDIIEIGFQIFTSDEQLEDLAHNPTRRAIIAPALADAHVKLNLLIYLRACELAGLTPRNARFIPNFTYMHASTDPLALARAFHRLITKFQDYERLARRRAQQLRREANTPTYGGDQRLDATHHASALCADPASHPAAGAIQASNARQRGAAIAAAGARPSVPASEHASALARGPPCLTFAKPEIANSQLPAGSRPHGPHGAPYAPNTPATLLPSLSNTTITQPPSGRSSMRKSDSAPPSEMISRRACSASRRFLKRGRPFVWGMTIRQFILAFERGGYLAT